MNLRYAKRSEDTEQINVASWAAWNERQYPELKWLHHIPNGGRQRSETPAFTPICFSLTASALFLLPPFGITDGGQPIFCIEISNESDLNEKEIEAAVQDEREAEQE